MSSNLMLKNFAFGAGAVCAFGWKTIAEEPIIDNYDSVDAEDEAIDVEDDLERLQLDLVASSPAGLSEESVIETIQNTTSGAVVPKSAAEKAKMEGAAKKSKVMQAKVAVLKRQEASVKQAVVHHTTKSAEAKKQVKALKQAKAKTAERCKPVAGVRIDIAGNAGKAKAAAADEANKRGEKEKAVLKRHAKGYADKASKALIAEEHDALHGKLMKEIEKIAIAEATKYAPEAAKKEVTKAHAQITKQVMGEVFQLVKKDAVLVARGLAMKEVQDQMDKSSKVKALVASVAKDAAKYFAKKFSKTEVVKLVADKAKVEVQKHVDNHTAKEIGKAQASAVKKIMETGKKGRKSAPKAASNSTSLLLEDALKLPEIPAIP